MAYQRISLRRFSTKRLSMVLRLIGQNLVGLRYATRFRLKLIRYGAGESDAAEVAEQVQKVGDPLIKQRPTTFN